MHSAAGGRVVLGNAVAEGTDDVVGGGADGVDAAVAGTLELVNGPPLGVVVAALFGRDRAGACVLGVGAVELVAISDDGLSALECVDPPHPAKATRNAAGTHATARRRALIRS